MKCGYSWSHRSRENEGVEETGIAQLSLIQPSQKKIAKGRKLENSKVVASTDLADEGASICRFAAGVAVGTPPLHTVGMLPLVQAWCHAHQARSLCRCRLQKRPDFKRTVEKERNHRVVIDQA